jgi:1-deoxy-D-xylulose-5-phosphate synthase
VAVIGDGALTGGMALAALNQIGHLKPRMTIVLNDNEMSISENVGALNAFMRRLQVQPWFQQASRAARRRSRPVGPARRDRQPRQEGDAALLRPGVEQPVPRHGPALRRSDRRPRRRADRLLPRPHPRARGPTMLHVVTRKGKGYGVAEADPITWHGASKYDPINPVASGKGYQWSDAFGDAAIDLAPTTTGCG